MSAPASAPAPAPTACACGRFRQDLAQYRRDGAIAALSDDQARAVALAMAQTFTGLLPLPIGVVLDLLVSAQATPRQFIARISSNAEDYFRFCVCEDEEDED